MIHQYKLNGYNIVLDTYSGSIHTTDELGYEVIGALDELVRRVCGETTALGAAYFAGLATGYWKDKNEIKVNSDIDKIFKPKITAEERAVKLAGWKKAVERSFDWAEE